MSSRPPFLFGLFVFLLVTIILFSSNASAQAIDTYVFEAGTDNAQCDFANPCRTLNWVTGPTFNRCYPTNSEPNWACNVYLVSNYSCGADEWDYNVLYAGDWSGHLQIYGFSGSATACINQAQIFQQVDTAYTQLSISTGNFFWDSPAALESGVGHRVAPRTMQEWHKLSPKHIRHGVVEPHHRFKLAASSSSSSSSTALKADMDQLMRNWLPYQAKAYEHYMSWWDRLRFKWTGYLDTIRFQYMAQLDHYRRRSLLGTLESFVDEPIFDHKINATRMDTVRYRGQLVYQSNGQVTRPVSMSPRPLDGDINKYFYFPSPFMAKARRVTLACFLYSKTLSSLIPMCPLVLDTAMDSNQVYRQIQVHTPHLDAYLQLIERTLSADQLKRHGRWLFPDPAVGEPLGLGRSSVFVDNSRVSIDYAQGWNVSLASVNVQNEASISDYALWGAQDDATVNIESSEALPYDIVDPHSRVWVSNSADSRIVYSQDQVTQGEAYSGRLLVQATTANTELALDPELNGVVLFDLTDTTRITTPYWVGLEEASESQTLAVGNKLDITVTSAALVDAGVVVMRNVSSDTFYPVDIVIKSESTMAKGQVSTWKFDHVHDKLVHEQGDLKLFVHSPLQGGRDRPRVSRRQNVDGQVVYENAPWSLTLNDDTHELVLLYNASLLCPNANDCDMHIRLNASLDNDQVLCSPLMVAMFADRTDSYRVSLIDSLDQVVDSITGSVMMPTVMNALSSELLAGYYVLRFESIENVNGCNSVFTQAFYYNASTCTPTPTPPTPTPSPPVLPICDYDLSMSYQSLSCQGTQIQFEFVNTPVNSSKLYSIELLQGSTIVATLAPQPLPVTTTFGNFVFENGTYSIHVKSLDLTCATIHSEFVIVLPPCPPTPPTPTPPSPTQACLLDLTTLPVGKVNYYASEPISVTVHAGNNTDSFEGVQVDVLLFYTSSSSLLEYTSLCVHAMTDVLGQAMCTSVIPSNVGNETGTLVAVQAPASGDAQAQMRHMTLIKSYLAGRGIFKSLALVSYTCLPSQLVINTTSVVPPPPSCKLMLDVVGSDIVIPGQELIVQVDTAPSKLVRVDLIDPTDEDLVVQVLCSNLNTGPTATGYCTSTLLPTLALGPYLVRGQILFNNGSGVNTTCGANYTAISVEEPTPPTPTPPTPTPPSPGNDTCGAFCTSNSSCALTGSLCGICDLNSARCLQDQCSRTCVYDSDCTQGSQWTYCNKCNQQTGRCYRENRNQGSMCGKSCTTADQCFNGNPNNTCTACYPTLGVCAEPGLVFIQ